MRILLFTENTHKGGLDTFLVSLILAWPNGGDEFCVLTNARHPGLSDLRARLEGRAEVLAHGAPAYVDLLLNLSPGLTWLRRLFSPLLRTLYLWRGTRRLAIVFDIRAADRLMIVSGGYPGGDSCLAAALAWRDHGRRPPLVFNEKRPVVHPRIFASVVSAKIRRTLSQNPIYVAGQERGVLPIGV